MKEYAGVPRNVVDLAQRLKASVAKYSGIENAYNMGRDCALFGPNEINCNSAIFATPEQTEAWERGKAEGEKEKS